MSSSSSGSTGPPTAAAISSQMVAAMNIVEPTLDLSVGQTMRKIIDLHAEANAQIYANLNIGQYANDISNLTGSALDSALAQFGIKRFAAKYATGSVTFTQIPSASNSVNQPLTIPQGTRLATVGAVPILYQTLVTFTLAPSDTTVSIPVQAVLAGSSGNVGASTVTAVTSTLNGISAVTNPSPITGGVDPESDAALITRFQATVFRSLAGTSQMFLGTAVESPAVTAANVIGAYVTHSEQIEIGSNGTAVSGVTDAAYVYPYGVFLATNLSSASSVVNEGSFTLGATLSAGVAITQITASAPVTFPAGTMLAIGSQVAYVSNAVNASVTIPISSFTPSATYQSGEYVVNYLYNTGGFLTEGIDFSVSTSTPLIADPVSGPTLTAAATTISGEGFEVAETLYYRIAYGNRYGTTAASPEVSVAVSGTSSAPQQVTVTWPFPSSPAGDLISQIYIYRGTASGGELLVRVLPSSASSWIDLGTYTAAGAYPTSNTTGVSVVLTSLNSATVVDNGLYQLQFNYIPITSRNDYAAGVLNRVDVYVAGSAPTQASEVVAFYQGPTTYGGAISTTAQTFSGDPASELFVGNFQRVDGNYPAVGNTLIPLSFSPLISIPSTIVSPQSPNEGGSATLVYETDYWAVNNTSVTGMSDTSIAGVELRSGATFGGLFPTSTSNSYGPGAVTLDYVFNAVEGQVDSAIQQWRLLSQDVQVHQATAIPLNFYLVVILTPGVSLSAAQSAISSAISSLLSSISFNGYLEPSAVISAVQGVVGVQAVRFARSTDAPSQTPNAYAIAPVSPTGAVLAPYQSGGTVTAVTFSDTTYPVFNALYITSTAQNLFGPG